MSAKASTAKTSFTKMKLAAISQPGTYFVSTPGGENEGVILPITSSVLSEKGTPPMRWAAPDRGAVATLDAIRLSSDVSLSDSEVEKLLREFYNHHNITPSF